MNLITTTELRTKSNELINTLLSGRSVNLIHRSRIIGEVSPKKNLGKAFTQKDAENIQKLSRKLNLPIISDEEIEKRYRKAMMKKHGQYFS
ncbi:MAG: hypothetical protein ACD_61C00292G0003 [uncultured bacterium]|nr:MAG: hypothetical protein ACD_61C00292G0003 [uncultured bacterium]